MSDSSPTVPQSNALAEASPDSLAELLSRDPEGYTRQDLDRVIAALRQQRERMAVASAAAQASGTAGKPRGPRAVSGPQAIAGAGSAEELDL